MITPQHVIYALLVLGTVCATMTAKELKTTHIATIPNWNSVVSWGMSSVISYTFAMIILAVYTTYSGE